MPCLSTLRHSSLLTSSYPELELLDASGIREAVIDPQIGSDKCLAHLRLLELFRVTRNKVAAWALRNNINDDEAWRLYVNSAILRLRSWFDQSGVEDISNVLPPLDVLMVWHVAMQEPVFWSNFLNMSEITIPNWNWDVLSCALRLVDSGELALPARSIVVCRRVLHAVELLDAMDAALPRLFTNDGRSTEILHYLFLNPMSRITIPALARQVDMSFDFHKAIRRMLKLADEMLQVSWHRMPYTNGHIGSPLTKCLERYQRFMALAKFWPRFRGTSAFFCGPLVPTLDIDLVWRTHMLFPRKYEDYCRKLVGKVVEHTPILPLREGWPDLQRTAAAYETVFGGVYSLCPCWFCETRQESGLSAIFRMKSLARHLRTEEKRRNASKIGVPLLLADKVSWRCGLFDGRRRERKEYPSPISSSASSKLSQGR